MRSCGTLQSDGCGAFAKILRSPALPAIMREGTVGLGHPVRVFALLDRVPPAIGCIKQLGGEPLGHRLFIALARRRNDPADAECLAPRSSHLNRYLIGRAADPA